MDQPTSVIAKAFDYLLGYVDGFNVLVPSSAIAAAGGATTFESLTNATTAAIPTENVPLANALLAKVSVGHTARAADVTVGRAFTAADFGIGIVPLNAGTVQNFILNNAVTMGLTATGGDAVVLQWLGALHTLTAGAGTTINYGGAAYTNALVSGLAPTLGSFYVLTRRNATDVWDLA